MGGVGGGPVLGLGQLTVVVPTILILLSLSSYRRRRPCDGQAPSNSALMGLSISTSGDSIALISSSPTSTVGSLYVLRFGTGKGSFKALQRINVNARGITNNKGCDTALLRDMSAGSGCGFIILTGFPGNCNIFRNVANGDCTTIRRTYLDRRVAKGLKFSAGGYFPVFKVPGNKAPRIVSRALSLKDISLIHTMTHISVNVKGGSTGAGA